MIDQEGLPALREQNAPCSDPFVDLRDLYIGGCGIGMATSCSRLGSRGPGARDGPLKPLDYIDGASNQIDALIGSLTRL
jgi:hypothetical protein